MDVGGRATQDAKAEFTQEFVAYPVPSSCSSLQRSIVSYEGFQLSDTIGRLLPIKKRLYIVQ